MSESLFDRMAQVLEERTSLSRLEARGTLRLVLRDAGLEPDKLTPRYAEAVVEKMLPKALQSRGVTEASEACVAVAQVAQASGAGAADAHRPETLFERLQTN